MSASEIDERGVAILDSSMALAWSFADEFSSYAGAVLARVRHEGAVVPAIWPLEIVNALIVAERRGRTTPALVTRALTALTALPIAVDLDLSPAVLDRVLTHARERGLSAYDAAYLELAIRAGLPLATLDQRLRDAAAVVGIPLFAVPEA